MPDNKQIAALDSPEETLKAKAIAVIVLLILSFKFLPALALGVIYGSIVRAGANGAEGRGRLRATLYGCLFFWGITKALFGRFHEVTQETVGGFIATSESFRAFFIQAANYWNSFFPKSTVIRFMRFEGPISALEISRYFWLSVVSMLVFILAQEAWRKFSKKRNIERWNDSLLQKISRYPVQIVQFVIKIAISRWFARGESFAPEVRTHHIKIFIRVAVVSLFLSSIGGLFGQAIVSIVFPSSIYREFDLLFVTPGIAMILGFFWGLYRMGLQKFRGSKGKRHLRSDEFFLGINSDGRAYGLSEKNLSYHVEIVAPTGSGKTNLVKQLIVDRLFRGHGLIFLDLKADFEVVRWLMGAAHASNRQGDVRVVSLANRSLSVPYNPIKFGSAPEIHSQLMNSWNWSEEYYRKISSVALMALLRGLCDYRDRTGELFHLGHIYDFLNEPGLLRDFCEKLFEMNCPSVRELTQLCEKLDRPSERDKLSGLVANLGLLIHSAAGELVSSDVTGGSFDFEEAVNKGQITYVLMNSMKLRETATVFGKLILQDLMRFVGDRYSALEAGKKQRPITLIIDEFASFAIPEFIEFMDRARGAGIGIVFAHQSRADLRAVSEDFQSRVEANANTVIVSGVKSSDDAEYYAGLLGTRTAVKETVQVENNILFGDLNTGFKSMREVEEYVVHPNVLKDLRQGEVFTVSRTIDARWALARIPLCEEFETSRPEQEDILTNLSSIRTQYMSSQSEKYLQIRPLQESPGLTRPETLTNQEANQGNAEKELWN